MATPAPNPAEILTALGVGESASSTPIAGGADTDIWRIETTTAAYCLRLFRPGQGGAAKREVAAMTAARGHGLPVPRIYHQGFWNDRPVMLIDWMPGQPLRNALVAETRRARILGSAFGRALAAIHQCPAPLALGEPDHWIGLAAPDEALRVHLQSGSGGRVVLIHLDYHPMNVLVADGRVSAILDWANARAGDPRADVARTEAILRFAPVVEGMPAAAAEGVRQEFIAGWWHGYHAAAGPLADMAPFYAWAGAFMVRDLAHRVGRPDVPWLTDEFLTRVQSWATTWRARSNQLISSRELPLGE